MKAVSLLQLTMTLLLLMGACSCRTNRNNAAIHLKPKLPENEIRMRILTFTPIGDSSAEVLQFVRTRLRHVGPEPTYEQVPATRQRDTKVGVTSFGNGSINVCLGEYGFPGRTATFISWGFDEHGKLVDVIVEKERDAL
jgi:hypothetical protein